MPFKAIFIFFNSKSQDYNICSLNFQHPFAIINAGV